MTSYTEIHERLVACFKLVDQFHKAIADHYDRPAAEPCVLGAVARVGVAIEAQLVDDQALEGHYLDGKPGVEKIFPNGYLTGALVLTLIALTDDRVDVDKVTGWADDMARRKVAYVSAGLARTLRYFTAALHFDPNWPMNLWLAAADLAQALGPTVEKQVQIYLEMLYMEIIMGIPYSKAGLARRQALRKLEQDALFWIHDPAVIRAGADALLAGVEK